MWHLEERQTGWHCEGPGATYRDVAEGPREAGCVRGHGPPAQAEFPCPLPARRGTVNHTPSLQLCFYLWNNSGLRIQPQFFLSVPISYLGLPIPVSGKYTALAFLLPRQISNQLNVYVCPLTSSGSGSPSLTEQQSAQGLCHIRSRDCWLLLQGRTAPFLGLDSWVRVSEHAQSLPEPKPSPPFPPPPHSLILPLNK